MASVRHRGSQPDVCSYERDDILHGQHRRDHHRCCGRGAFPLAAPACFPLVWDSQTALRGLAPRHVHLTLGAGVIPRPLREMERDQYDSLMNRILGRIHPDWFLAVMTAIPALSIVTFVVGLWAIASK